jgi:carboxymethylenebutenolidase
MAYVSRAPDPSGVGVILIPAMRGLKQYHKDLSDRFANIGIDAVTFDYYGRQAPDGPRDESFDFEGNYELIRQPEARPGIDADIAAAIDFLLSPKDRDIKWVFTLGFCFGAAISWWQSAVEPRVSGCIGLYGITTHAIDLVPQMRRPLLLLMGGNDAFVSLDEVQDFEAALEKANVPFESKVYPGAPHSFFDRRFEEHRQAEADASATILDFIRGTTQGEAPVRGPLPPATGPQEAPPEDAV